MEWMDTEPRSVPVPASTTAQDAWSAEPVSRRISATAAAPVAVPRPAGHGREVGARRGAGDGAAAASAQGRKGVGAGPDPAGWVLPLPSDPPAAEPAASGGPVRPRALHRGSHRVG